MEITIEQVEFLINRIISNSNAQNLRYDYNSDFEQFDNIVYEETNKTRIKIAFSDWGRRATLEIFTNGSYITRTVKINSNTFKLFNREYKIFNKLDKHIENLEKQKQFKRKNLKIDEVSAIIDKAFPDAFDKDLLQ